MSALLSEEDLNDFISPGVACIKPVEMVENKGEVEIQIDEYGKPLQISKIDGKVSALAPANINLSDCLACSGCITSAEEVLVAQHSHDQFLKALEEGNKTFVVSISHQSRASLANVYGLSVEEMDERLILFFKDQLGFAFVVGTALGRKLSLLEESHRVIEQKLATVLGVDKDHKPILSSICPGWVLYAEKTHPYVLPYLSLVKSPQQITGCLLKELAAKNLGCPRESIYHLSIMPCFDKKLESARTELEDLVAGPDVDCVLTPKEFLQLLESSEYTLFPGDQETTSQVSANRLMTKLYTSVAPQGWPCKDLSWSNDAGSESGGYSYYYIHAMKERLLEDPSFDKDKFSIVFVEGKNSDIYELRLMYDGEKHASAAVVNGFRNIQNLVRKLKPSAKTSKSSSLALRRRARTYSKFNGSASSSSSSSSWASDDTVDASKVDYVEVMACPNGCINGGGQISKPPGMLEKEWLSQAKAVYWQIGVAHLDTELSLQLQAWAKALTEKSCISETRLYNTHFNEIEKPTNAANIMLGAKW